MTCLAFEMLAIGRWKPCPTECDLERRTPDDQERPAVCGDDPALEGRAKGVLGGWRTPRPSQDPFLSVVDPTHTLPQETMQRLWPWGHVGRISREFFPLLCKSRTVAYSY